MSILVDEALAHGTAGLSSEDLARAVGGSVPEILIVGDWNGARVRNGKSGCAKFPVTGLPRPITRSYVVWDATRTTYSQLRSDTCCCGQVPARSNGQSSTREHERPCYVPLALASDWGVVEICANKPRR